MEKGNLGDRRNNRRNWRNGRMRKKCEKEGEKKDYYI